MSVEKGDMSSFSIVESTPVRWRRRALTIPAYFCATALLLSLLPLLLLLAGLIDATRGKGLVAVRCLLATIYYFSCESVGLLASCGLWLISLGATESNRYQKRNLALQSLWARAIFTGLRRLFGIRLAVSGEEEIGRGPVMVFIRHASILDTLLPAIFLSHRHGLRLRYVLKRELLWDPCLDVVGQRLPNVFVRRGSERSTNEIEGVRRLARDLAEGEGVLIYPEGTRFTPEKRERALAALARSDPRRLAAAQSLRHVLPPRRGGPLALLEARPDVDVLFFAHVGFDGAATFGDLWSGAFTSQTVRVRFWRVPAASIPSDSEARAGWLDTQWADMDAWIGEARRLSTAGAETKECRSGAGT